jgi:hypothetical protein
MDLLVEDYRKRITREDDLLNTRTGIFLVTNTLLMAASNISRTDLRLPGFILGFFITIFWMMCSRQSLNVLKQLTIKYRRTYPSEQIENIVQNALPHKMWMRPTYILAVILPVMFIITWISFLILTILILLND